MTAAPPLSLSAARQTFAEPLPAPPPRRRTHWPALAVAACIVLGIGLRVLAFWRDPSLWGDEAMLALNVVHRPVGGLLKPLDLNQGAPVGYLILVKLLTQLFGNAEWVLRLPSLVAALVSLPLVGRIATRELSRAGALWATALFALAPHAVGYAGEFKQYGFDLGVAAGLVCLGQTAWLTSTRGAFLRLAIGGAAAVWFSHPAAFVLAGIGAALCARPVGWTPRLIIGGVWAVSFALVYLLFTRHLGGNRYLADYWAGVFWPLPPRSPGDLAWLVHHLVALFDNPAGFGTAGFGSESLAALVAALALLTLIRTRQPLALVIAVPVGVALLASALGKYPFAGRFMLYAVPGLMLAVGEGVAITSARLRPLHRLAPWLLGGALLAPLLAELSRRAQYPEHAEDVRGAVEFAANHWQPGDRLAATPGAHPAMAYYLGRFQLDPAQTGPPAPDLSGWVDAPTWLVVAHAPAERVGELRARLARRGTLAEVWSGPGARLWRWTPVAPAEATTSEPAGGEAACPARRLRVVSGNSAPT